MLVRAVKACWHTPGPWKRPPEFYKFLCKDFCLMAKAASHFCRVFMTAFCIDSIADGFLWENTTITQTKKCVGSFALNCISQSSSYTLVWVYPNPCKRLAKRQLAQRMSLVCTVSYKYRFSSCKIDENVVAAFPKTLSALSINSLSSNFFPTMKWEDLEQERAWGSVHTIVSWWQISCYFEHYPVKIQTSRFTFSSLILQLLKSKEVEIGNCIK